MKAEDTVTPRIRGELENFAKDAVEYYQKTGLVPPKNLETTAQRIAEVSFKAGMRKVVEWIEQEQSTFYIYNGQISGRDTKCDNELMLDLGDWQAFKKEQGL